MTAAEVYLWGSRIGIVMFQEGEPCCRFQYDPAFARSGIEVSPLMMPLSNTVY